MKTRAAIFLLAMFLSSCAPTITPTTTPTTIPPIPTATPTQESAQNQVGDECIPPEAEWEYPIKPPDGSEGSSLFVPPSSDWEAQTGLPEKDSEATLQLIEHQPGYDVLWATSGDKFLRFRTDTKQWNSLSFKIVPGGHTPYILFQDRTGQIWALGSFSSPRVVSPLFSRLNDKGQFEFVSDLDNELTTDWWSDQAPLVDKENGTFWMILNNRRKMALYSFDPNTKKAKLHLSGELNEFGGSLAMGQDGSIFLIKPNNGGIARYYPDNGTSENFGVYYKFEGSLTDFFYPYLFVDRAGNLWIGDYVWIDFKNLTAEGDYTWHQIIRSPLFISKYGNLRATYLWMRPRPMLQSSDGRIWFNGGAAGLVWLDPQKGIWCKFTTIQSNILEDRDGNLWLLYDSNLYKYSITPQ